MINRERQLVSHFSSSRKRIIRENGTRVRGEAWEPMAGSAFREAGVDSVISGRAGWMDRKSLASPRIGARVQRASFQSIFPRPGMGRLAELFSREE